MVRGIKRPRGNTTINTSKGQRVDEATASDNRASLNSTSKSADKPRRYKKKVRGSKPQRRSKRKNGSSSGTSSGTNSSSDSLKRVTLQLPNNRKLLISVKLLQEIRQLQMSADNFIPKLNFSRLVREIVQERGGFKMEFAAMSALQIAAEYYSTVLFEDTNKCALHAKRITIKPPDMHLVLDLRSAYDPAVQ